MHPYVTESFTSTEREQLSRFVTKRDNSSRCSAVKDSVTYGCTVNP